MVFSSIKTAVTSASTDDKENKIEIAIKNSVFKNNGRRSSPNSLNLQSTILWLDVACRKCLDIRIKNTSFQSNLVQVDGMVFLENKLGHTKFFVEDTELIGNGENDTGASNNLFVLSCENLTLTVNRCRVLKNQVRLLSVSSSSVTQITVSNTDFAEFNGGILFIESNELELLIENCLFDNHEGSYSGNGGAVYISAQSSTIVIQNSGFNKVTCSGYGGVFYISSPRDNMDGLVLGVLTMRNSIFISNAASYGGVVYVDLPFLANITMEITDCRFGYNGANGGSVFRFATLNSIILFSSNTIFEGNYGGRGAVIYTEHQKSVPNRGFFNIVASNVTFSRNHAGGPGGVMSLHPSDVTRLYFHNVSFVENEAMNERGGALYISNDIIESHNNMFELVTSDGLFAYNFGIRGGALFLSPKSELVVVSFERTTFNTNVGSRLTSGGALYIKSTFDARIFLSQCLFEKNNGKAGGAIYLQGSGVFSSKDSIFQSNSALSLAGAMFLQMSNSTVSIVNTTFIDNSCTTAAGGALFLEMSNGTRISVLNSSFKNNTAMQAFGGAVFVKMSEDRLNQSGCEMSHGETKTISWRSWIYNNTISFENSLFEHNIAVGGGALSMVNGAAKLRNCTFIDNFASVQGGHISNYGSNCLQFVQCTLLQVNTNISTFHLPSFIQTYSAGPFVLLNSTIDQRSYSTADPLIMVSKGGLVSFNNFSSVICPPGSFVSKLNLSYPNRVNDSCTIQVTVLRLSCQECNPGFYSLQRGYTTGLTIAKDFTCIPCPQGANCFPSIKSKLNYWGYLSQTNPPALNFTLCPLGYCRSPRKNSDSYNSCYGNRRGFMCGRCRPGYTEVLFSTDCRLTSNCSDYWFWPSFVALIITIALFLVFKPPVITFAVKQLLWFKRFWGHQVHQSPRVENNRSTVRQVEDEENITSLLSTEEVETEKTEAVGYLEIIFNFYQISNLILSCTSLEDLIKTNIIPPIVGVFNFQQRFSNGGLVCRFPGLTPQTKKFVEIAPLVGTLFAIFVVYVLHRSFCRIRRTATPRFGPYLIATMEVLLLGYARIASVSLFLVRCVSVGSRDRWFFNGDVPCYQWWQYALLGYNIVVVVPFIFVLAWGSIKLHQSKISAKELVLGCVLPLPLLTYWFARCIRSDAIDTIEEGEYTEALKQLLHKPFRKPSEDKGALYWESVLIGRRFVLVFLYCFITDTSIRLLCMTFACALVCLHHSKVEPFRNPQANTVETVSLLSLVVLAVINLYKSLIVSSESQIEGSLKTVFHAFGWIEICLLGFLPAIVFIIVVFGIMSSITRLLYWSCRCLYIGIASVCLTYMPKSEEDDSFLDEMQ